jgi:hypothetical protein
MIDKICRIDIKFKLLIGLFALSFLVSCGSTIKQQKEGQLAVLKQVNATSKATLEGFKSGTLPQKYDIHLFFRYAAVNKALAAIDGYEFPLPNNANIAVKIGSIRLKGIGASPLVSIQASARTGELTADVEIGAILTPISNNATAAALQINVLSFAPRISWWIFELTKIDFVNALLAVELNKIALRLPKIELPVAEKIKIGGTATQKDQTFNTTKDSTLTLRINIPATQRERTLSISNYVFLEDGLHIFGSLK